MPSDTVGQQRGSRGPTRAEFQAATDVITFEGKPYSHSQPPRPAPAEQRPPRLLQPHMQAAPLSVSSSRQGAPQELQGPVQQQQQQQQPAVNSGRGQKRVAGDDTQAGAQAVKRGKYVTGQVSTA